MNKLQTIKIKKCRLCKSNSFIRLHSYGNLFVSNFVDKKNIKKGIRAPLNLLYCKHCKLLQLEHSAPQEIMYKRFYWYRSGVTETMKVALKDIYNSVLKLKLLKKGDTVLDIGANDGTLLSYFKKQFITVGCEPAKNLTKELKKNCKFVLNDFWSFKKYLNISVLFYIYFLARCFATIAAVTGAHYPTVVVNDSDFRLVIEYHSFFRLCAAVSLPGSRVIIA